MNGFATAIAGRRGGIDIGKAGLAALWLCACLTAKAQQPGTASVSNFNAFPDWYEPPHGSQAKSQIQGSHAEPLPGRRYDVKAARLTTFKQDGSREVLIAAPECIYDEGSRSAGSGGPVQMHTADGKFQIQGEGFLWQQTNYSVFISNEVHTIIQADLLARPVGGAPPGDAGHAEEPVHIFSHQFDYSGETGLGKYRENVRVVGTNLGLSTRLMTVQVPMKERQLQTITAEGDVGIDYSGVHATGDRAVYRADTGLANITGQPRWMTEQREGGAQELIIDATNRVLHANHDAWLKMSGQTFGTFGARTPETAPAPATNHFVEIFSDDYDLGTNSANFRRNVRAREMAADQVKSTMNCGELTAWYSGTNQLQRMVAERGVTIEQQEEQLRAGKAVYTSTNGLLELTDQPSWRSGTREGKGVRMLMVVPENELSVYGDAYMKLPASEAGRSIGGAGALGASATNQFAELFSEEYVVRPNVALFEGKVRLLHPQITMSCDHLAVHSAADKEKGQSLVAEHSVIFDLLSTDGQKVHGTCQNALYDYSITGGRTNDSLEMTGHPVLETTNGTVQNSVLLLDRTQNKLIAPSVEQVRLSHPGAEPGRYRIKGTLPTASTNRFSFIKK